jgi:hypothetical protein
MDQGRLRALLKEATVDWYDEIDDEETFGTWEGQCQACEMWGMVNDLMLCEECDARLQRDLIRARDWDYAVAAFGLDDESRERLRAEIIRRYGARSELITNRQPEPKSRKRRRRPGK